MKTNAKFYHAGCPVCLEAQHALTDILDHANLDLEIVHLGIAKQRIAEAESVGVKSVPALVVGGTPLHLNFGASITALR